MPSEPATWIEAALVSVTVSVSDCPAEMLLELALMDTVGMAAAALPATAETTTKVRRDRSDEIVFKGDPPDVRLYEVAWNVSG